MAAAVLVLYLLAVIGIGFYMRRRVHTEADYLAASAKRCPPRTPPR